MKLADVLSKQDILPHLLSTNKQDLITELVTKLATTYTNINKEQLIESLLAREAMCSTAVDHGVAIPHARIQGLAEIIAVFGRSVEGVDFESLDGKPTHLFVLVLAPEGSDSAYINILARISKIFRNEELRGALMQNTNPEDIYDTIISEDAKI